MTDASVQIVTVLAQSQFLERFRLRTTSNSSSIMAALILLATVIVIVWIASRWFQFREGRRTHSPRRLFRELCRAHSLTSREKNQLLRLCARQQPYNPAAIFIEPQRFDTEQLASFHGSDSQSIQQLRDKLFGPLVKK